MATVDPIDKEFRAHNEAAIKASDAVNKRPNVDAGAVRVSVFQKILVTYVHHEPAHLSVVCHSTNVPLPDLRGLMAEHPFPLFTTSNTSTLYPDLTANWETPELRNWRPQMLAFARRALEAILAFETKCTQQEGRIAAARDMALAPPSATGSWKAPVPRGLAALDWTMKNEWDEQEQELAFRLLMSAWAPPPVQKGKK